MANAVHLRRLICGTTIGLCFVCNTKEKNQNELRMKDQLLCTRCTRIVDLQNVLWKALIQLCNGRLWTIMPSLQIEIRQTTLRFETGSWEIRDYWYGILFERVVIVHQVPVNNSWSCLGPEDEEIVIFCIGKSLRVKGRLLFVSRDSSAVFEVDQLL